MQIKRMKRQLSAACHYSYTRLALNYYMYYETSLEESLLDNRLEPLNTACCAGSWMGPAQKMPCGD